MFLQASNAQQPMPYVHPKCLKLFKSKFARSVNVHHGNHAAAYILRETVILYLCEVEKHIMFSILTFAWRESGKTTLSTQDRDSNLDFPVIGSLICCESSVLDHATTKVVFNSNSPFLVVFKETVNSAKGQYNKNPSDEVAEPVCSKLIAGTARLSIIVCQKYVVCMRKLKDGFTKQEQLVTNCKRLPTFQHEVEFKEHSEDELSLLICLKRRWHNAINPWWEFEATANLTEGEKNHRSDKGCGVDTKSFRLRLLYFSTVQLPAHS
ncbi:unnamed protein product [Timema podura]|uniref:Uncharacterized protein n=1 Tax=Timema podura TaxID=61482 RepID=A0ABN7NRX3_TIMPD|nr:unnamed protein product [Timema podura]